MKAAFLISLFLLVWPAAALCESGDYTFELEHQGRLRFYEVHVPDGYDPVAAAPLVMNLHGGGGNPEAARRQSLLDAKADTAGFIAVYPAGTGRKLGGRLLATWNAGECCGYAQDNRIDDVGFIRSVLRDLSRRFRIDRRRVYVTGLSNGAIMAYRLACELSEEIAAIAPLAAHDALRDCRPARQVPVMHFHGKLDLAAPYLGGKCGGRFNRRGWQCRSVPEYLAEWSRRNGCPREAEISYQKGEALCRSYGKCQADSEVVLCSINDGGHTWPGGAYASEKRWWQKAVGKISQDLNANDMMWDFFTRHSLP